MIESTMIEFITIIAVSMVIGAILMVLILARIESIDEAKKEKQDKEYKGECRIQSIECDIRKLWSAINKEKP